MKLKESNDLLESKCDALFRENVELGKESESL